VIPESAPFTPAQRAWLNGFFAGFFGGETDGGVAAAEPTEDFPWHDPVLDLSERLALAEGRSLPRRLMSAMAQLDCGQCGYQCQTYAEALAEGRESSFGLCQPGGKVTREALKTLMADVNTSGTPPPTVAVIPKGERAPLLRSVRLTGNDSDKDVRRIAFDISGTGVTYEPGDSLGVIVAHDPALVDACLKALGATEDSVLRHALAFERDIARPLERTCEVLAAAARDPAEAATLRRLAADEELEGLDALDLRDLLELFPSARPPLADLLSALPSLKPRLYSIASSPRVDPDRVELCVGVVRDSRRDRWRDGVASCHLAFRADEASIYVQQSHFRLPTNPETPIIMVGPGTGIAPFRAFLQDRAALGIKGNSWLFFGDRHARHDFLYRDELLGWQNDGTLERLSLAWSRDGATKDYVQHRMREHAAELWRWLERGAYFYVCGDASRMARDVDAALKEVAMGEGGMDAARAREWAATLTRQGRYQRDVY
jgi:sulfite reductase (NADPH) flavoprotein alpha-component